MVIMVVTGMVVVFVMIMPGVRVVVVDYVVVDYVVGMIVIIGNGLAGTLRRSPTHASPAFQTIPGSRTPVAGSVSNSLCALYDIQQTSGLLLPCR